MVKTGAKGNSPQRIVSGMIDGYSANSSLSDIKRVIDTDKGETNNPFAPGTIS